MTGEIIPVVCVEREPLALACWQEADNGGLLAYAAGKGYMLEWVRSREQLDELKTVVRGMLTYPQGAAYQSVSVVDADTLRTPRDEMSGELLRVMMPRRFEKFYKRVCSAGERPSVEQRVFAVNGYGWEEDQAPWLIGGVSRLIPVGAGELYVSSVLMLRSV